MYVAGTFPFDKLITYFPFDQITPDKTPAVAAAIPPSGTAGFERSFVSGNRRVPWPPPRITERTLLVLTDWRLVCDMAKPFLVF